MIATTLVQLIDPQIGLPSIHQLWTTLEGENPSGSIKDRMVLPELERLSSNKSNAGPTVISEVSAGSTALSLAYYAQKFGFGCHLFVPDTIDPASRLKLLAFDAVLTECHPATAYSDYEIFCGRNSTYRFDQMVKKELRNHYIAWAETNLTAQLPQPLSCVMGAVGTGHSLLGISMALQPACGSVSAEPLPHEAVQGVRNLSALSFGKNDPCEVDLISRRLEIDSAAYFKNSQLEASCGLIHISDSFRLTLGAAVKYLREESKPAAVFLVGSHCRRSE